MTLKETIDDIRSQLKNGGYISEMSICNGIVVRLIKELGWPIFDPWTVIFEYNVNKTGKKVDLVLCEPKAKPVVFIEIKAFERLYYEHKRKEAIEQLSGYISDFKMNSHEHEGVPIAILTDGQKWIFFHPIAGEDWKERPVCELDLMGNDVKESVEYLDRYLNHESVCKCTAIKAFKADHKNLDGPLSENRVSYGSRLRVKMPDGEVIDCQKPRDTFCKVIEKLGISKEELTYKISNQPNIWQIRENLIKIGRWHGISLRIERLKKTDK